MHHLQARVVPGDEVLHRDAEQLAEDLPQLGQTVQAAVITGIGAFAIAVGVRFRAGQAQQRIGQIQLLGSRLTAGQIQAQLLGLQLCVVALLGFVLREQIVAAERQERHRAPFTDAE